MALPTTIHATSLGCRCTECPLKDRTPVLPPQVKAPTRKKLALVAETPAEEETKKGQFLVGATGDLLDRRFFPQVGIRRSSLHISNALLCWPGRKLAPDEWKAAIEACRPRLSQELAVVKPRGVIAAGGRALQALTGNAIITRHVGAPIDGEAFYTGGKKKGALYADFRKLRVLPTFHPARCFRDQWQYIPVIRVHFLRAKAMSEGLLPPWDWGELHIEVNKEMLQALKRIHKEPAYSVDIETSGVEPWDVKITCIGFGTETSQRRLAVSVPWDDYRYHAGKGEWLECHGVASGSTPLERQLRDLVLKMLGDKRRTKVFQNGTFDRAVLRMRPSTYLKVRGIEVKPPFFDTLHAHMLMSPGTEHDLGFQTSTEFHADRWKDKYRGGGTFATEMDK